VDVRFWPIDEPSQPDESAQELAMTTIPQMPAPADSRTVTPRTVVWVELPRTGADRDDRDHTPAYDPTAMCEECERWDGMA
jgi:hypothetical protein